METFSALPAICAGNSPVPREIPAQRPVTRNFDVFFDLRPNKLLSKHSYSWGWLFEIIRQTGKYKRNRKLALMKSGIFFRGIAFRWWVYMTDLTYDESTFAVIMIFAVRQKAIVLSDIVWYEAIWLHQGTMSKLFKCRGSFQKRARDLKTERS